MEKNLGPKTKKNLEEALAGESMARNRMVNIKREAVYNTAFFNILLIIL